MKILSFETLSSTQTYLKELIAKKETKLPLAVVTDVQTKGLGSRDNEWKSLKGNLFVSFALSIKELPKDLKLESSSIYFSSILQETLSEFGSNVWLKWPNDMYIDDMKIGGMITNVVGDIFVCGFGLNIKYAPHGFGILDLEIDKDIILTKYFKKIEKKISWKQVFSKYKLNFYDKQKIFTHINGKKVSLDKAVLEDDGSLSINDKRIYSLR